MRHEMWPSITALLSSSLRDLNDTSTAYSFYDFRISHHKPLTTYFANNSGQLYQLSHHAWRVVSIAGIEEVYDRAGNGSHFIVTLQQIPRSQSHAPLEIEALPSARVEHSRLPYPASARCTTRHLTVDYSARRAG